MKVSTIENNLRLPGQYFDRETGLHYNYFRDYDPTTGRYVEADPIGLAGGSNLYLYANAAPTMFTDPTGEFGIPGAIAGGIVGGISGFSGAYATGGNLWAGAGTGAATGAFFGGLGPLATLARTMAARAGGAALSNAAGQVSSNFNNPCFRYNVPSTIGSAVGGAFSGAWQFGFAGASSGFGSNVAGRIAFGFPGTWSAGVANATTNIYLDPNFLGSRTSSVSDCTCQ